MTDSNDYPALWNTTNKKRLLQGAVMSYLLSAMTFITFVFAMIAVPISGANAPDGGVPYPYLNTLQQYPRDFIWQYLAIPLLVIFVIQYTFMREHIHQEGKFPFTMGLVFAIISTVILLCDYYIQVNVVPVSLAAKETAGIPLLIQYNPHGIFIALEESGYMAMLLSIGCTIPVYWGKNRSTKILALINLSGLIICAGGFMAITIKYGLEKKDRFEVVIISITWLLLIINGLIMGNRLRRDAAYYGSTS